MSINAIQNIINKYAKPYEVFTPSNTLSKTTGRFTKERIKKIRSFAMFQKKYSKSYEMGGDHIEADVKIYSNDELLKDDEIEEKYKIVFVDKREECTPVVYLCYGVLIDDN